MKDNYLVTFSDGTEQRVANVIHHHLFEDGTLVIETTHTSDVLKNVVSIQIEKHLQE